MEADRPDHLDPAVVRPSSSTPVGTSARLTIRRPTPRVWWVAGPVLAVTVAMVTIVASVQLPYIALSPGTARSVEPLVKIKGRQSRPADDILFLTVSVRHATGIEALLGWLDGDVEVDPERVITGGQSESKNEKFNLQLMSTSKDKATKVALEKLGHTVTQTPAGAVVIDVDPKLPVFRSLTPGDTVIEAAGKPVKTSAELVTILQGRKPGDPMMLVVRPLDGSVPRRVTVTTVPRPGEPGRAFLGVSLETRQDFHFPVDVSINSGAVGGPSAGLAFTLAIIDRLTPGSLTGRRKVAVTGTMEIDGTVGPVGGVHQKTVAAIAAGAQLMLVPADEYRDAVSAARGRIRVDKVRTLDDALRALASVGGNSRSLLRTGVEPPGS